MYETEKKILGLKSSYCKFVNINNMPSFKIKTFNNKSSATSFISRSKNGIQILNIQDNYVPILKNNAIPVIYHEFTHIVDNEMLLPELDYKTKEPYIKMYSEYHAIQVQMRTSLHFESYNELKKISLEDETFDWFKPRNVQQDIDFKTNDFISTINHILDKKQNNYVYYLMLHCVYYQSMCDFWKDYCSDNIINLLREDVFKTLFGSEFDMFHHSLYKIDDKSYKYFKLLYLSQRKMIQYFGMNESNITKIFTDNK